MNDTAGRRLGFRLERVRQESLVLLIHDTTTPNCRGKYAAGVPAHFGTAISGAGHPLGLCYLDVQFRQGRESGSFGWQTGLETARRLMGSSPDTRVVTIWDHEDVTWELLLEARASGLALLVRLSRPVQRCLSGSDSQGDFWTCIKDPDPAGYRRITVQAGKGPGQRRDRKARLALRTGLIEYRPLRGISAAPIRMVVVSAREDRPSASARRRNRFPDWIFLTTEGEPKLAAARRVMQ